VEPDRAARHHFSDHRHFRTLQRGSEEGIAPNILASRLRDLGK
jgi:DNA-binding HxlR family transcriptional regulator